jgi:hypothetical protein
MMQFGSQLKQSFMAKTTKKSLMIMKSQSIITAQPKFSDHLTLRDPSNRAYKDITSILRQNNMPASSKFVFSDYVHKYKVNLDKE